MASRLNQFQCWKNVGQNTTAGGAGVSTNQSNFPIPIIVSNLNWNQDSLNCLFGSWNPNGKRVQFFDEIGNNLSYEVESFDTTNKIGIFHVKKATVTGNSSTDFITMGFGNDPNHADQDNAADVWSNGYTFVDHLTEPTGGQVDSRNGLVLTASGSASQNQIGYLGKANLYPGAGASICPHNSILNITDQVTISNWFKLTANNALLKVMVCKEKVAGGQDVNYRFRVDSNNALRFSWTNPIAVFQTFGANTVCDVAGGWYYGGVSAQTIGSDPNKQVSGKFYLNGAPDGTFTGSAGKTFMTNAWDLIVGNDSASHAYYGYLDEIRIANLLRTDDWMKLEFKSMKATAWSGDGWLTWGQTHNGFITPMSKMWGL